MFKPSRSLTYWFHKYNKLYFNNSLPYMKVGWNDEIKNECACAESLTVGFTKEEDGVDFKTGVIQLDPKQHLGSRDGRLSLLHEMIHAYLHPYDKHGEKFQAEKRRLESLGAITDLW